MRAPPSLPEVASFLSLLSLTFQAQFLHRHKTTCSGLYSKTDERLGGAAPSSRALPSGRVSGEARAAVAAVCPPLGGHSRAWGLLSEEVGKALGRAPGPRDHGVLNTARPPRSVSQGSRTGSGEDGAVGSQHGRGPRPSGFWREARRRGEGGRCSETPACGVSARAHACVPVRVCAFSCVFMRAHVRRRGACACACAWGRRVRGSGSGRDDPPPARRADPAGATGPAEAQGPGACGGGGPSADD